MPKIICKNPDCNNEYYAKPSRVAKGYDMFCSKECSLLMRTREREEKKKFRWNTICKREGCGKKYWVSKYKKDHGLGIYCSHECYSLDKVGSTLADKHKEKISKATKRMWEEGVFDDPEIRKSYVKSGRDSKGRKWTKDQRKKKSKRMKGKPQPQLHTPKAIAKAIESRKGITQTLESNKKRSEALKGREFSKEHRQKLSEAHKTRDPNTYARGENNANWRGGKSLQGYPSEFKLLSKDIRKRDNETCRICYKKQSGRSGVVHHIDGNKSNNDESNLIFLCRRCHGKIHWARSSDPIITAFKSALK
jgi:hypothetical protein